MVPHLLIFQLACTTHRIGGAPKSGVGAKAGRSMHVAEEGAKSLFESLDTETFKGESIAFSENAKGSRFLVSR